MNDETLTAESTVCVVYIGGQPQQVWDALTEARHSKQYFFGHSVESDWQPGSSWRLRKPDGAVSVWGEVRASEPPRKLVVSWRVDGSEELRRLPEVIVTYEIEPVGDSAVRLTMSEAHPTPIPARLLEGGRRGWPMILSGLKTLVETGQPLRLPKPEPPRSS